MKAFIPGERVKYRDGNGEYTVAALPDKDRQLPLLGVVTGLYSIGHTDDLVHVDDVASAYSEYGQALLDRVADLERRVDENVGSINRHFIQIGNVEKTIADLRKWQSRMMDWLQRGFNV